MKKSKIFVLFILIMVLCGCKISWMNKFQFSDLKYKDNYIVGKVKNTTDNKYKITVYFKLKSGSLVEGDSCQINLDPNQTKDIDCSAYYGKESYDVKIKKLEYTKIPTLEEKNFKNGDDISTDDLKDYFEDIYDNHTLFNLSLLTKYSDNNSYPYIKSISYKDDKIHIYNNVVKENVSIDILEIYSVDNSELEQYIAKIYYDTEDELKEFKSSFSLALLTLSESINTYNVSKALEKESEDGMCYIVSKYCISYSSNSAYTSTNKYSATIYLETHEN